MSLQENLVARIIQVLMEFLIHKKGFIEFIVYISRRKVIVLLEHIILRLERNKSTEDYTMGGGQIGPVPMSMSLAVTFFSAITILGPIFKISLITD